MELVDKLHPGFCTGLWMCLWLGVMAPVLHVDIIDTRLLQKKTHGEVNMGQKGDYVVIYINSTFEYFHSVWPWGQGPCPDIYVSVCLCVCVCL